MLKKAENNTCQLYSECPSPLRPPHLQQHTTEAWPVSASHTFPAFWDHISRLLRANLSHPINMANSTPKRHIHHSATVQTHAHHFTCTHLPRTPCTQDWEWEWVGAHWRCTSCSTSLSRLHVLCSCLGIYKLMKHGFLWTYGFTRKP